MSAPAHSPAPFRHVASFDHGHLILDDLGDSIGALSRVTGDHPAEEQLANARLFTASPLLLSALKAALPEIDHEIEQRNAARNAEYVAALQTISDEGHRAVRLAETGQ